MDLAQPFAGYMGVDGRGGNIRMSQQELHHTQISAVVEQMRRKGMAQGMR